MLYSTKIATKKKEYFYFLYLQLDINQARNRTSEIQGSLNDTLELNNKILSYISRLLLIVKERKTSADKDIDGRLFNTGDPVERETAYTESSK